MTDLWVFIKLVRPLVWVAVLFLVAVASQAQTVTGNVAEGAYLFQFGTWDGNGRGCYLSCHKPRDKFGMTAEKAYSQSRSDPYYTAAAATGDNMADLERAIIASPTGPKSVPALVGLNWNCGWNPRECLIPLGIHQDGGTDLIAFLQSTVPQHLTKSPARIPYQDYTPMTEQEAHDIAAFLFSL